MGGALCCPGKTTLPPQQASVPPPSRCPGPPLPQSRCPSPDEPTSRPHRPRPYSMSTASRTQPWLLTHTLEGALTQPAAQLPVHRRLLTNTFRKVDK